MSVYKQPGKPYWFASFTSFNPETGKAHMAFDECWYCLACEIDCPKDAITVKIPFLLR